MTNDRLGTYPFGSPLQRVRQKAALEREYLPRQAKFGMPQVTLPDVPKEFANEKRRAEVLAELVESQAEIVILLGDQPIKHWLRHYDGRWKKLSEFGPYGQLHDVRVAGRSYHVLPLAHPRQVGALGAHSDRWFEAHKAWRVEAGTMFRG